MIRQSRTILKQRVDYTTYDLAVKETVKLAREKKSAYTCIANVHMIMESYNNKDYREMGMNAKIEYDTKYTPDNNYNKLIQIYNNTIQNK